MQTSQDFLECSCTASTRVPELENHVRQLKQQNHELENRNEKLKRHLLDMELQMGQMEVWSSKYFKDQAEQRHVLLSQRPEKEPALNSLPQNPQSINSIISNNTNSTASGIVVKQELMEPQVPPPMQSLPIQNSYSQVSFIVSPT